MKHKEAWSAFVQEFKVLVPCESQLTIRSIRPSKRASIDCLGGFEVQATRSTRVSSYHNIESDCLVLLTLQRPCKGHRSVKELASVGHPARVFAKAAERFGWFIR